MSIQSGDNMAEKEKVNTVSVDTKDVPVLYFNAAATSMSFNDVRIYVSEVTPKTIDFPVSKGVTSESRETEQAQSREPNFQPRICLVMSPEYAKNFAVILQNTIKAYEKSFGALRVEPTHESIMKSLKGE
jgi:hypothetical protein